MYTYSVKREYREAWGYQRWVVYNDLGVSVSDHDSLASAYRTIFNEYNGDIEYNSIVDILYANHAIGEGFFEKDTLRFWNSKVHNAVYNGYFVTSEDNFDRSARLYSVRTVRQGRIKSVEFQTYDTRSKAHSAAKRLAKG